MLPVLALIGRPNVGKSTLFNRLTRSRDALVADQPGLTRDRQYGLGKMGENPYLLIDTGGLSGVADGVDPLMEQQVEAAMEEADHLLFLVDARAGMNASDEAIAERLRRSGKPITLVINKTDQLDVDIISAEFYSLGLGEPKAVAAVHGRGVRQLIDDVLSEFPEIDEEAEFQHKGTRIAFVGRPNVGKSTMINRLMGEERVVAYDLPGTTRDSIFIPFERDGKDYTLIDTAGVRKRGRIHEAVEKFSVIKTLQAIEQSNVVLLILDASEGITEQDAHLAGHIVDSGRAVVVIANKWDGLSADKREQVKSDMQRRLQFLDFASWRFTSALHGTGVGHLLEEVDKAFDNSMRDLTTPELNAILERAVEEHQPPLVHGRRIKLRYAHQGGKNPPIVVLHGNQTEQTPNAYRRYLVRRFRDTLRLHGTPVRLEFKTTDNPYKDKRNKLTSRQINSKRRLMRHVKGKK